MTEDEPEPPSTYQQAVQQLGDAVMESLDSPEVLAAARAGGLPSVKASMKVHFPTGSETFTAKLTLHLEVMDPSDIEPAGNE